MDGELDLVSLTQSVRDVHLQRGVRLQVHIHGPGLQDDTHRHTYPIMHLTTDRHITCIPLSDYTCYDSYHVNETLQRDELTERTYA